jgi:glucosylceramidase
MRRIKAALGVVAAMTLATALGETPAHAQASVRHWVTTGDQSLRLTEQPSFALRRDTRDVPGITVAPDDRKQSIVGFGASITDASAYLIQTRMTPPARDALLRTLFGRDGDGLGFSFTRVTVGASDFSLDHYSLADAPDPSLAGFSTQRMEEHVFPTVRAALAINPDLKVMASPWSAPGWMKTTGSLIQGTLKPEHYTTYADYWLRYIRSAADNGVPTHYLSIQNEPDFEPDSYPGMRWPATQRAVFIGRHLGPALAEAGIDARILDWDHNWDQPQQPLDVLADDAARPYVSGVAWHCYAGDVAAQDAVRRDYPDKDVFFTECSGGDWAADFDDSFGWTMKTLIIGSTRHWARGVLMWNLALDENDGPHAGGCGNCRGVVTIDSRTGAVTPNQEYYAFGHASRFVRPGAERVGSSQAEGISSVAFVNPDGQRVLVLYNERTEPVPLTVGEGAWRGETVLPARSAATYVWAPPEA